MEAKTQRTTGPPEHLAKAFQERILRSLRGVEALLQAKHLVGGDAPKIGHRGQNCQTMVENGQRWAEMVKHDLQIAHAW